MPVTPEFSSSGPLDDLPGDAVSPAGPASDRERVQALIDTVDGAARDLRSSQGLEHTLELIVKGAVASVPAAQEAGITLVDRRGHVSTEAPTSPMIADLDGLQAELHEGPCIDSAFDAEQVTVVDLDTAEHRERWPRFAPAATERGVTSMLAVELFSEPGTTGALNMYSAEPGAFDRDSREIGALFASHAAIALFGAQRAEPQCPRRQPGSDRAGQGRAHGAAPGRRPRGLPDAGARLQRPAHQADRPRPRDHRRRPLRPHPAGADPSLSRSPDRPGRLPVPP